MTKPYSFLLYFLSIIFFFFAGLGYAGLIEAGKGQMLAGGAIVLGYGVMGAFIGLCLALIFAYKANRKTIIRTNVGLAVGILAFWAFFAIRYQNKQAEKAQEQLEPKMEAPQETTPTLPADNYFR